MKKIPLLFMVLFLGSQVTVRAADELDFAFSLFKGNGAGPFASALYQEPANASLLASRLNTVMQGAGDYLGYEIVSRRYLTKKIERITVAIYFDRHPVYMRIDLYDIGRGRIFLPATVSKEASDILPLEFLSAAGR